MTLHNPGHNDEVLRYERAPRMVHALLASSFVLALLTGLILLWNPLSFLAAGGVSRVVHRVAGLILWLVHPGLSAGTHAALLVVHDLGMLILTLLLVGHLYFTYVYKAISGMTTGYVDEDEARLEHPKWVEELEELEESQKVSKAGSIPAD